MKISIPGLLMLVPTVLFLTPAAQAGPVLEFNVGGITNGGNATFGWSFTTNAAVNVVALDSFASSLDPAGTQVRLYNSTGTVLASAKVLPTDPTEGTPTLFASHAISPVALLSGQTYYIVEDIGTANSDEISFNDSFTSTDPAITYGSSVSSPGPGGVPTTDAFGTSNGYFGPNFDIASVPEPSSLVMVLAGIVAGVFFMRGRDRRTV